LETLDQKLEVWREEHIAHGGEVADLCWVIYVNDPSELIVWNSEFFNQYKSMLHPSATELLADLFLRLENRASGEA